MPKQEKGFDRQPKPTYAQVDKALGSFTDKLLEQAISHTDVWKRGNFRVGSEKIPSLYAALSQYPFRRLTPQPGSELPLIDDSRLPEQQPIIATELPKAMIVGVEEFDHRAYGRDYHEQILRIGLLYKGDDPQFEEYENNVQVALEIVIGRHELLKNVYMSRYSETGYEGHGFDSVELSPDDLNQFLQLAVDNLGTLISEQSFTSFYKKLVYVCRDTGKKFRYDEVKGTHVSEEGITMAEYQSPLVKLDDELSDPDEGQAPLKEVGRFFIEIEEENS